jgi:hypothetical protein
MGVGAIIGDAEADKLVRIAFSGVDFRQQFLGPAQLFQPARRRSEANLLIR